MLLPWVKDGAALQIHNFFGPEGDFYAVSGERAPGGYCGPAGSYHGDSLPGVEARGNCRRGRRVAPLMFDHIGMFVNLAKLDAPESERP